MLPIYIDGVDYSDTIIIDGLTEDAELREGIGHMTRQDGTEWYDIVGTRLTKTVEIRRKQGVPRTAWDGFFSALKSPVAYHNVTLGTSTFKAHITVVSRTLKDYSASLGEIWGDSYTVTFEGTEMSV